MNVLREAESRPVIPAGRGGWASTATGERDEATRALKHELVQILYRDGDVGSYVAQRPLMTSSGIAEQRGQQL